MMILSERQRKELAFAKTLGVIESTSEDYLQGRMKKFNEESGGMSYGKTTYNEHSFLSYILAIIRMDFVFGNLNYRYKSITQDDIKEYYENNKTVFLRENGEYFGLEEMEHIIIKRLREAEYEEAVNGILL